MTKRTENPINTVPRLASLTLHIGMNDAANYDAPTVPVRIVSVGAGLEILPHGLGLRSMQHGFGGPLFLEREGGVWKLYVWADINQEDPTHVIDLSGAAEALYRDTEPPNADAS